MERYFSEKLTYRSIHIAALWIPACHPFGVASRAIVHDPQAHAGFLGHLWNATPVVLDGKRQSAGSLYRPIVPRSASPCLRAL